MATQRKKAKGSVLAAVDIGSTKIACLIGRVIDHPCKMEIIGVGNVLSQGIENGTITDLKAAEYSIRQSVHAAEHMAAEIMKGYPLREVVVNVSGIHTSSFAQHVEIKIGGYDITDKDITRALSRAQSAAELIDQQLIHTIPVSYAIDGGDHVREPRGMNAENLSLDAHLIAAQSNAIKNITKCIERSHLDITAHCNASYAAGLSSLVQDEKDLGCTIIDIGGGVTSFAVFHDGHVIYTDAIPIGGTHVTNDIAQGLTTSVKDAERIKCLYGSSMAGHTDETELIDVPKLGEVDRTQPNHISRSILVGIIQPRMEEIFEMVRGKLKDSGLSPALGRRIVLTGGASQLHGTAELAEHVLDKKVRLGHPIGLQGLPDAASGPTFSTAAGLLIYGCGHTHEIPADITAEAKSGSVLTRMQQWLKENW